MLRSRIIIFRRSGIFIGFFLILLLSCKKETSLPGEIMGYEYFPLVTGQWIIYQVDSFVYSSLKSQIDTTHYQYQVKEVIGSIIEDNSGAPSYKIERYLRPNDTVEWQIKDIWTASIDNFRAIKTEENVKFIKLTFPVKENNNWNGNAYNTMGEQEYVYTSVNQSKYINGLLFDMTCVILQENLSTLISEKFAEEMYAMNIGLIYKRFKHIEKELNQNVKSGIDYSYKLTDYGL